MIGELPPSLSIVSRPSVTPRSFMSSDPTDALMTSVDAPHGAAKDRIDSILEQWATERPDLDVSAMGPIGRIFRVAYHLSRELAPVFTDAGLDSGLFDVLCTLRRAGPPYRLSPRELNAWCMLTSGAMTARLDRLESARFVTRKPDPDDRR